jgi:hypothetical protein
MSTRGAAVPLGDILSITTGWILAEHFPDSMVQLVQHIVGHDVTPLTFPAAVEAAKQHLLDTVPWLLGLRVPAWLQTESSNVRLWCWLDTQEMRHGRLHVVESMQEGSWTPPELIIEEFSYIGPEGNRVKCAWEDLPEVLQAFLRTQGYDPD